MATTVQPPLLCAVVVTGLACERWPAPLFRFAQNVREDREQECLGFAGPGSGSHHKVWCGTERRSKRLSLMLIQGKIANRHPEGREIIEACRNARNLRNDVS